MANNLMMRWCAAPLKGSAGGTFYHSGIGRQHAEGHHRVLSDFLAYVGDEPLW